MTRGERGFTLLEVIVALAILSVSVVAVIQGFAQGLRLLKLAGEHQHATLLADQKAREIVTPVEGREDGHDEETNGAFTWERQTTLVETPIFADQPSAKDWRVYRIDVHVRWGSQREVEVATLRTVPVSADTGTGSPTVSGPQTPSTPGVAPAQLQPPAAVPPRSLQR